MPLLDREDKTPVRPQTFKLRDDLNARISAYAEWSESSRNHVVTAALFHVFGQDKEFRKWWDQHREKYLKTAGGSSKTTAAAGGK